jgi:hypothetical protein
MQSNNKIGGTWKITFYNRLQVKKEVTFDDRQPLAKLLISFTNIQMKISKN